MSGDKERLKASIDFNKVNDALINTQRESHNLEQRSYALRALKWFHNYADNCFATSLIGSKAPLIPTSTHDSDYAKRYLDRAFEEKADEIVMRAIEMAKEDAVK